MAVVARVILGMLAAGVLSLIIGIATSAGGLTLLGVALLFIGVICLGLFSHRACPHCRSDIPRSATVCPHCTRSVG